MRRGHGDMRATDARGSCQAPEPILQLGPGQGSFGVRMAAWEQEPRMEQLFSCQTMRENSWTKGRTTERNPLRLDVVHQTSHDLGIHHEIPNRLTLFDGTGHRIGDRGFKRLKRLFDAELSQRRVSQTNTLQQ